MRGPLQAALRRLARMTRPLALRAAGRVGSGTAVVEHVGRRSGRSYQTPVVATEHTDEVFIALPYGERTDWLRSVLASGSTSLHIDGRACRVDGPTAVPMAQAAGYFRAKEQRLHRRLRVESALRLHRL